jgi:hypothetical protein
MGAVIRNGIQPIGFLSFSDTFEVKEMFKANSAAAILTSSASTLDNGTRNGAGSRRHLAICLVLNAGALH